MVLNTVAVTGHRGLLGMHITARLSAAGVSVIPIGREQWDLSEWQKPATLDALFAGANAVIHAGAMVPEGSALVDDQLLFDSNVRSCLCLGEWALMRNIPIIFISGATVYATPERADITEDAPKTCHAFGGFYGFTKLLAENIFDHLRGRGLKVGILRPSSIYGYGMPTGRMVASFLATAMTGKTIVLRPPLEDRIDLVHAADVARAALAVLEREAWDTFNIASEAPASLQEVAATCIAAAGHGQVEIMGGPAHRPPLLRFGLNCTAARERLGYNPCKLHEGISAMLAGCLL